VQKKKDAPPKQTQLEWPTRETRCSLQPWDVPVSWTLHLGCMQLGEGEGQRVRARGQARGRLAQPPTVEDTMPLLPANDHWRPPTHRKSPASCRRMQLNVVDPPQASTRPQKLPRPGAGCAGHRPDRHGRRCMVLPPQRHPQVAESGVPASPWMNARQDRCCYSKMQVLNHINCRLTADPATRAAPSVQRRHHGALSRRSGRQHRLEMAPTRRPPSRWPCRPLRRHACL